MKHTSDLYDILYSYVSGTRVNGTLLTKQASMMLTAENCCGIFSAMTDRQLLVICACGALRLCPLTCATQLPYELYFQSCQKVAFLSKRISEHLHQNIIQVWEP